MKLFVAMIMLLVGFSSIVFPNSNQIVLVLALFAASAISTLYVQKVSKVVVLIFVSSWAVTLFYALVGISRAAPDAAIFQAFVIYIFSPLLWVLSIHLAYRLFGIDVIVRALGFFGFFAALSVGLYFFLIMNFGSQSVSFFGSQTANVYVTDSYSGVTMHVSGSLVFLAAAFAAEPKVIRSNLYRALLLLPLVLATFAAGRSMAILAIFFGFLMSNLVGRENVALRMMQGVFVISFFGTAAVFAMDLLLGVNLVGLIDSHVDKILSGEDERPLQMAALIEGAETHWFLGAGHGIGVQYLRSQEFPWRYEAVWFALLYKIGLLGTLVILFPFLCAIFAFLRLFIIGSLRRYDVFFGSALITVLFASLTNPYIEAFAFQWMYILPTYYFFVRNLRFKSPRVSQKFEAA